MGSMESEIVHEQDRAARELAAAKARSRERFLATVVVKWLRSDFDAEKSYSWFAIAESDGVPIGICRLCDWREACPMITSVSVIEEYRNVGVGSLLIRKCLELARVNHKEAVSLYVNRENINAIRLYRRLGFLGSFQSKEDIWMTYPLVKAAGVISPAGSQQRDAAATISAAAEHQQDLNLKDATKGDFRHRKGETPDNLLGDGATVVPAK